MTIYSSDYVGLRLTKARLEELQREAKMARQVREALQLQPVKRRIRLPKITISWN
jgi:hypothetical protein